MLFVQTKFFGEDYMKMAGLSKICWVIFLVLVFNLATSLNAVQAQTSKPKPIVLKAVTFMPSTVPSVRAFFKLQERVNERSNGQLIIEHKGGPESIPSSEQVMAVKRKVVDMAWVPAGWYLGVVPALEAMELSRLTALEERKSGFYDTMLDLHKKSGLYYLGRGMPLQEGEGLFFIFINKPVDRPKDLAGQKIGRGVVFLHFLKKLGAVSVSIPRGEEYTALETGVVNGIYSALAGFVGYSGQEVCKNVINHPVGTYNVMNLINLDVWNKLPGPLQNVLMEAQLDLERDWPAQQAKIEEESWQKLTKAGVKIIKFSEADAKWFVNTAYDAEWEALVTKYPEIGPKLMKQATK
jgi:TRAP-type C4-dicarboxylate transport system substrate-binding protein